MPFFAWLLTSTVITAPLAAGTPELHHVLPRGGQRGADVTVELSGVRLDGARDLIFYGAGIALKEIRPIDADRAAATLTIAADAPLGVQGVRVVTADGVSNLKLFSIGNLPQIGELESNNDRTDPQKVPWPVCINGTITNEDVDYFAFDVAAGQRLNFEIEAMRLGDTVFDPYIAVMDARGAVLADADDTPLVRQDAIISHTFGAVGTCVVQVRESSYRGDGNCHYRLHVGAFPRPQGVFPPGGRPGETIEVRWLGDASLGAQTLALPRAAPGAEWTPVYPADDAGVSPSPVPMRIGPLAQVLEAEPNDSPEAGTPFEAPGAVAGVLQAPGDVDWFTFNGVKDQTLLVRVFGRELRSPIDSVLTIRRLASGNTIDNDDSGGPDSLLRFGVAEDGPLAVGVRDLLDRGGESYTYRVEVAPVAPSLVLTATPDQQVLPVPAGGRNALRLSARRSEFAGPIHVEMHGWPEGVSVSAPAVQAGVTDVPIVVTAAEGMAPATCLLEVAGRHADPNVAIAGRFRQEVRLSDYMNNTMCAYTVDRLAAAITRAAPFSIDVVQPQAPLVLNGWMDLKVVAHRSEGFDAPIQVQLLWNPPGVGSGSGTIAPGQTETTIRINANGSAAAGDWPLVVTAVADVGGPLQVSSQLATLTVAAAPFEVALDRGRVTQGESASFPVKITLRAASEGAAKPEVSSAAKPEVSSAAELEPRGAAKLELRGAARLELRGLPRGVTAEPVSVDATATDAAFALQAAADAPPARSDTVYVTVELLVLGEPVRFNSGRGVVFLDAPLPRVAQSAAAPPAAQSAEPPPAPAGEAPAKPKRVRLPRRATAEDPS
ncbi:MAG: hypothetical protein C4547_07525 [Phycisphaerales bacterium]|nr:MAG: hypothetical protein C4547_07525 [Phycisphaerales bacterium]